jgi:DNA-binding response OmpR family regulator
MCERTIIAVVDDLMFQSRLEQQVRRLGFAFAAVDSEAELRAALRGGASLAIVDLHVRGIAWPEAVSLAKEHSVPILAFGRHTEAQLLREARNAGCDRVVARSQLVEELAALIDAILSTDAEPFDAAQGRRING